MTPRRERYASAPLTSRPSVSPTCAMSAGSIAARRSGISAGGRRWRQAGSGSGPRRMERQSWRPPSAAETSSLDDTDRRVPVSWNDAEFDGPVTGAAVVRPGYGGIVLGPHPNLKFDPLALARQKGEPGRPWPLGDAVDAPPAAPAELAHALDAFFTRSTGAYGVL